ncbi:MAG: hypothetical protein J07HQW1_01931 [Haloquadratum walsbyi J07HQW1]|uniref:Uncharacterized protein n=1 Tax=Haloquadratum walsbyi J07HQW1 TaxID=1238424 RepID=U1PE61_9EURY|nr:MAG: hypothetical protein J07HQW1_01931 [Haloquadratum walsbyi J07HQW1]
MSETDAPSSWLDLQYVSTVVGAIATGAFFTVAL